MKNKMKYSHRMLWLKMNEFHYNWTDMNKCEITILNVNLFTRAEHIGWWAFIDRNVSKLFVLVEWKKSYFNLSVPFELDRFECLQIQISLVNIHIWLLKFTVELLIVVWAYLSLLISSILDTRAKRSNKSNHLNNVSCFSNDNSKKNNVSVEIYNSSNHEMGVKSKQCRGRVRHIASTQFIAIYDVYNFALVSLNWSFNGA